MEIELMMRIFEFLNSKKSAFVFITPMPIWAHIIKIGNDHFLHFKSWKRKIPSHLFILSFTINKLLYHDYYILLIYKDCCSLYWFIQHLFCRLFLLESTPSKSDKQIFVANYFCSILFRFQFEPNIYHKTVLIIQRSHLIIPNYSSFVVVDWNVTYWVIEIKILSQSLHAFAQLSAILVFKIGREFNHVDIVPHRLT